METPRREGTNKGNRTRKILFNLIRLEQSPSDEDPRALSPSPIHLEMGSSFQHREGPHPWISQMQEFNMGHFRELFNPLSMVEFLFRVATKASPYFTWWIFLAMDLIEAIIKCKP